MAPGQINEGEKQLLYRMDRQGKAKVPIEMVDKDWAAEGWWRKEEWVVDQWLDEKAVMGWLSLQGKEWKLVD